MSSLIPSNSSFPEPIINDCNDDCNDSLNNLINYPNLHTPKLGVSLCLNMIVRNESKIIKRLLTSVLPIIDTYVICDTGSTDDTVSIIKDFFNSKGIQGEVITEPFKNFGYNRTFALKAARGKATYALLLDADMIFKIEPTFNKELLTAESYLIIQKGSGLSYHNTRLIKLDIDAKCVGPTHEYYDFPAGCRSDKLDSIWIDDIGDGGSKGDKFERDIRLLKQGIEEEPNNGRYYFYLANSYFNTGKHKESIEYYKKRIEIGGWVEEVFYSYLNLGHSYMSNNQSELAISTWMNGYNHHSKRSETIYEICKYYRLKGMNKISMAFCMLGKSIPYPKDDTLFIHNDVYETGFDYELSIIGYYNNYPNIHKVICKLMNNSKQSYDNHLSNYKFYCPKLSSYPYLIKKIGGNVIKDDINICGTQYKMNASNPCIFKLGDRYKINIRFVNYLLNRNGTYHFEVNDGKIATVNKIFNLDEEFNIIGEPLILKPETNNLRYVGMEDLKLFPILKNNKYYNTDCAFIGTCENPINNRISMGYGKITLDGDLQFSLNYKVVNTPYNKDCEKNWVFYNDSEGNTNIIYQWYPLTIAKINDNDNYNDNNTPELKIINTKEMPPYFKNVRGSSNGYEISDELWFLCHVVEYCQPREYYHFFAVFDKNTMDIKRWSQLFKFEGEKIEYALGLIVEEKRIIISYSKWDSEPTIGIYDKEKVEKEMF
jgi:tetratricopeptide (TPR) repeat protein